MTRTSIKGFNELFMGEIPKESVILVTGSEGTLKSSLVLNMISNALSNNDEHGYDVIFGQINELSDSIVIESVHGARFVTHLLSRKHDSLSRNAA